MAPQPVAAGRQCGEAHPAAELRTHQQNEVVGGGQSAGRLSTDEERFSKWVLECKWNNDKLKRQAEVLVGRLAACRARQDAARGY